MDRVHFFDHNMPDIGLFMRTSTQGDEIELVKEFIDFYCNRFTKNNKNNNLAVFIEPRIASGFPDIVFASYSPNILDNWSPAREKLDTNDLKILSHLILAKGCSGTQLITDLKLPEKQTLLSIEKLLDANMVFRAKEHWRAKDLKNIYSIKKLVSVEAKMNNMKKVVEQSIINTWFASQSYALTNISNPQSTTLNNFQEQGVGLYCKTKSFKKVVEAQKLSLPSSYLSLQFNEWVGNAIAH
jgi:predicted transcriptional regulator